MTIARGLIVSFDATTALAVVRLHGSTPQTLTTVQVSRFAQAEIVAGRNCLVDTGDHGDPADNLITAVWQQTAFPGAAGMKKVQGAGFQLVPSAAAGIDPANSGTAWTSGAWSQVHAGLASAVFLVGLSFDPGGGAHEGEIDIGTGAAGAETAVASVSGSSALANEGGYFEHFAYPIAVAASTRLAVRVRSSVTGQQHRNIKLTYVLQADLVDL